MGKKCSVVKNIEETGYSIPSLDLVIHISIVKTLKDFFRDTHFTQHNVVLSKVNEDPLFSFSLYTQYLLKNLFRED